LNLLTSLIKSEKPLARPAVKGEVSILNVQSAHYPSVVKNKRKTEGKVGNAAEEFCAASSTRAALNNQPKNGTERLKRYRW
jgi:hypothetical protein